LSSGTWRRNRRGDLKSKASFPKSSTSFPGTLLFILSKSHRVSPYWCKNVHTLPSSRTDLNLSLSTYFQVPRKLIIHSYHGIRAPEGQIVPQGGPGGKFQPSQLSLCLTLPIPTVLEAEVWESFPCRCSDL
jgi:hypothetical protein